MMNNFFFTTVGEAQNIIFDADYIMLKYTFTDGRDLDTRTRITIPVTSDYLGWARLSRFPPFPSDIILDWGGDNTGSGNPTGTSSETILIDMINYKVAYPTNNQIKIECRCFWYGTIGGNPVTVEATLWKGGTVIKNSPPFQFSNPTATNTKILDSLSKVITLRTTSELTDGEFIAFFNYNTLTNEGSFTLV